MIRRLTIQQLLTWDGKQWTKCDVSGEFSNILHNPLPRFVRWQKQSARYLKLEPLTEINGKQLVTVGEIGILTE